MDRSTISQFDFQTFFRDWVTRLEHYLHQLHHILRCLDEQDESKLQQLIRLVTTHYDDYYLAKAQVSRQDVFLVLSPPWISSYERPFLWLSGFRPILAINIVKNCGLELSPEQAEGLERLRAETKDEEKEISEGFARVEEQLLAPQVLLLAMMGGGDQVNGMVDEVDAVMDRMAEDVQILVACADYLREKTVAKLVGMLSTTQTVRFLAAMAQLETCIRRWGQQKEQEAMDGNVDDHA